MDGSSDEVLLWPELYDSLLKENLLNLRDLTARLLRIPEIFCFEV